VDMGADIFLPTIKSGENAIDIATRKNNNETAQCLKQLSCEKYNFLELDEKKAFCIPISGEDSIWK